VFHPQSAWVFDPWRIMLFHKLDEELESLNETLGVDIKINHHNKSERVDFEYSPFSLSMIHTLYEEDFKLYTKYEK
jgi:hypothetical protein